MFETQIIVLVKYAETRLGVYNIKNLKKSF